jgi:histidinol-phosphate aminotransferase
MKKIQLHKNESYWLLDEKLVELVRDRLSAESLSTYPEYGTLKKHISEYVERPLDEICITAGSDAAISIITELCVRKGLKIILPTPTFYGYERILIRHQAEVVPTFYRERDGQFIFPLQETLEEITTRSAVFLCNPNNPLGCVIPKNELDEMLERARENDALVVMDEAYFEYGGESLVQMVGQQPLIVLRTLSKAMGLSGARVGYAVSTPDIVRAMEKMQLPWPVAHQSACAAETLLEHRDQIKKRRDRFMKARETFAQALTKIAGLVVYPSHTNFVLLRVNSAPQIANALAEKGIIVATTDFMTSYPEGKALLHDTLRLVIPSPEDTPRVLEVLSEWSLQTVR